MSLVVQWLGLSTFTVVTLGSILGWGTKILQVVQPTEKKKKEGEGSDPDLEKICAR